MNVHNQYKLSTLESVATLSTDKATEINMSLFISRIRNPQNGFYKINIRNQYAEKENDV